MRSTIDMIRVWAVATGLLLVAWVVVRTVFGHPVSDIAPMLIASILGFELSLLGHDTWRKRERRRG